MWARNSGDWTWRRPRGGWAVVPGRLDAVERRRGSQYRAVPADPEAVTVCGLDAQAGVEALVDEECSGL